MGEAVSSGALAPDLSADSIIAELSKDEGLPREALRAAAARWESVLPVFLDRIEAYIRDPAGHDQDSGLLFLAVHLLGQMREPRAYRPLLGFLSIDPDRVIDVLGDARTETLGQIIASVFDGDPQPLHALILNDRAESFVRSAAFGALAFLTVDGRIAREQTIAFLHRCDVEMQPRDDEMPWVGWQTAIAYLGLDELRERVRQAFNDERITLGYMEFEDFEEDLAWGLAGREGSHPAGERFGYFGDAIETLSGWYGFSEEALRKGATRLEREDIDDWEELSALEEELEQAEEDALEPATPYVNPHRNVGRNDPCPCGSGKKYKKCCLK